MPALFTRMSSFPNAFFVSAKRWRVSSGLETSACTATAFPPACRMRWTTASAPALLVAQLTTTAAPAPARCSAIAAPIPFDAPVTTATCPCSFFDMTGLLCFLTGTTIASGQLERDSSAHWLTSLARPPGFAECPERNLEQGQVLDENLPQDRRQGREAETCPGPDGRAETILSGSLLTASSGLPGAPPRGRATVGERTGAFASGMPTPES